MHNEKIKINLAIGAGFCFGVKRALEIVFKTAAAKKNVYILGDIVHNEDVIKDITKTGIRRIESLRSHGAGKTLILCAHGSAANTLKKASALGYKIIDATCPMVKHIHTIAKEMEKKGLQIIVIGDKKHAEVRGILGQLKTKAIVVDTRQNLSAREFKGIKNAAIVVQSTQNMDKVMQVVRSLKKYIPHARFFNTICRPTRIKQEEIKRMPLENDVMIIIGSKHSANTRRLYEISKSLNQRSFWVHSKTDINPDWFKLAKSVGITAGASTPERTIKQIIAKIS